MSQTWREALSLAARLGVPPEAFWRLSVVEWRAIAGAGDAACLNRAAFDALVAQYPDTTP